MVTIALIMSGVFFLTKKPAVKSLPFIEQLTSEELAFLDSVRGREFTIGLSEGNQSALFLIEQLSEIYELNFDIVEYRDFGNLYEDTKRGNIDFGTYFSYSVEREDYFDYSEPVGLENVYLFTNTPITSDDISGKTILVSRGSIFEDYLKDNFSDVTVEYYSDVDAGLKRLSEGQVFGFVGSDRTYEKALSFGFRTMNLKDYIPISPIYIVSKKGENKELLKLFSKFTSCHMYSQKLYDFEHAIKYGLDISALQTLINKSSLDKNKTYKVMLEFDDPYVFNKNGEMVGFTHDIVEKVFELLDLKYEIVSDETTTWDEMYNSLLDNKIDVLGSIVITDERSEIINFSKPIWRSNYYVIHRDDMSIKYTNIIDLQSQNIGVVNNDFRHTYLKTVFPRKQFTIYQDATSLLDALLEGDVDYLLLSEVQHTNFVYKTKRTDIKRNEEIGVVFSREVALGFPKSNEGNELALLFSSAYDLIDFSSLKSEYFESISLEAYYEQERLYLGLLIVAILTAAFLILLVYRRKLRGDWPTGTLNRYAFKSDFKNGIALNKTFIFIDINKLKQLNDIYGHLVVDKILLEYCTRISSSKYNIYRVGGDEFVIVDVFKKKDEIHEFAKFLSNQHIILEQEGIDIYLTASIGVIERVGDVIIEQEYNQRSYLLSLADYTMYRAKNDSNLSIKYCNQDDIDSHLLKVEIENILDVSINEVGIYPVFQPILDVKTEELAGFEALARWNNGSSEYLPDQFIPVFENLNKINELDIYIFEEAMKKLDNARKSGIVAEDVYMSSNFSVKSLGYLNISDFEEVSARYDVPKANILIEITESTFFDDKCFHLISSLKESGYKIAIDDFSSGHSTINTIVTLNVDIVKIDKYIVENIYKKIEQGQNYKKELLILSAITKLIKSIESKVIVEGVEHEVINRLVKTLDVDAVQGIYFSYPEKELD